MQPNTRTLASSRLHLVMHLANVIVQEMVSATMTVVNVHEAKTQLSRLLAEVEAGAEVIIARDGKPVARLVPVAQRKPGRRFGSLRGQIATGDAFLEPLPEAELKRWE